MATECNKLVIMLIFTSLFQLSFSAVQLNNKISSSLPIPALSHLIFPVQGDVYPLGVLFATVAIGNPPSLYYLDVDTGSNLTWIQCKADPKAKLYLGPHPPYIPKPNSKIIHCNEPLCSDRKFCSNPIDQCHYEVEYADDGSSLGVMLKDSFLLKFGNQNEFKSDLAFGCGYDQDMRSPYFVDGVLGLSNGQSSIVGQLSKMGFKNAHGHCFGTNRRGFVFIGDRATPSGTVWTAMSQNQENHYILGPADLVVGNAIVAKNLKVVFDSGSTYTYLNENTYQATLSLVNKGLSGKNLMNVKDANLPVCWSRGEPFRSFDEVKSYFSTLFLNFHNNARFMLPPEAYLIISSYGNVCFGILNSREANMDSNIVGAIAFQDKLLIYDNEQNRVGWVPDNCI